MTRGDYPTCDTSLGSLTFPAPEAREFVELVLLCVNSIVESVV